MAKKLAVTKDVQGFVVSQLEGARKRLQALEKKLVKRGRAQQKEIEALVKNIRTGKPIKLIEKQATAATAELKKRFDALQNQALSSLGVATQAEITQIYRELTKLSKKLDGLVTKKATLSLSA
jgi:protein subunit release factor A